MQPLSRGSERTLEAAFSSPLQRRTMPGRLPLNSAASFSSNRRPCRIRRASAPPELIRSYSGHLLSIISSSSELATEPPGSEAELRQYVAHRAATCVWFDIEAHIYRGDAGFSVVKNRN